MADQIEKLHVWYSQRGKDRSIYRERSSTEANCSGQLSVSKSMAEDCQAILRTSVGAF